MADKRGKRSVLPAEEVARRGVCKTDQKSSLAGEASDLKTPVIADNKLP